MDCPYCPHKNPDNVVTCQACGAPLSASMPSVAVNTLPGGTKLHGGHFTVGKVLGQGGFGHYLSGERYTPQAPRSD